MEGRGRRIALTTAAVVAVWFGVVVIGWAVRPLHDSIPIGTDWDAKTQGPASQSVTCNTLFASTAHDGALPALRRLHKVGHWWTMTNQFAYQRGACTAAQRDARVVFGLDSLAFSTVEGGLLFVGLRKPRSRAPAGATPSYA